MQKSVLWAKTVIVSLSLFFLKLNTDKLLYFLHKSYFLDLWCFSLLPTRPSPVDFSLPPRLLPSLSSFTSCWFWGLFFFFCNEVSKGWTKIFTTNLWEALFSLYPCVGCLSFSWCCWVRFHCGHLWSSILLHEELWFSEFPGLYLCFASIPTQ